MFCWFDKITQNIYKLSFVKYNIVSDMRGEKKVIKIVIAAFLVVILLSVTSQATSIQIYQLGCKRPILPPPIEKTSIDPKPKIQKTVIIYLTKADNNANITIPLGAKINLTLKNYGDGGY